MSLVIFQSCSKFLYFKKSLIFHEPKANQNTDKTSRARALYPEETLLVENKTIEFMFAGINMFWARLRLILARAVRRGLK